MTGGICMVITVTFTVYPQSLLSALFAFRHRRRELQHKERLAAIEKARRCRADRYRQRAPWTPRVYLLRGMMWLFSGIGLTLFLAGISATTFRVNR